jgi:glycopeptide antibiotics resistance protein
MFMILTIEFYFIFDTQHKSNRIVRLLTFVICTIGGSITSEIIQGTVNSKRVFDVYDIVYNMVGSLGGIGLCTVYEHWAIKRNRLQRITLREARLAVDDESLELSIELRNEAVRESHQLNNLSL